MLAKWLVICLAMTASSCVTYERRLKWQADPFVGDDVSQAIVRRTPEGIESIRCESPRFRGRICYTPDEIIQLKHAEMDLIRSCEKWHE